MQAIFYLLQRFHDNQFKSLNMFQNDEFLKNVDEYNEKTLPIQCFHTASLF